MSLFKKTYINSSFEDIFHIITCTNVLYTRSYTVPALRVLAPQSDENLAKKSFDTCNILYILYIDIGFLPHAVFCS